VLIDTATHRAVLCDFGSAKKICKKSLSVSYVCSRFYRAPECLLGRQDYGLGVDLWALGCVLGEMVLGGPVFGGEDGVGVLREVIEVLGGKGDL
jgi:serine/threonine protein kinase